MNQEQKNSVINSLFVSLDMMGQSMSEQAVEMMATELYRYDFNAVQNAIKKCTRECKYRINLAEIVSRIDDGRPSAEEAWQEVYTLSEHDSKVMTREQQIAFCSVSYALQEATTTDLINCKRAFVEKYNKLCEQAKADAEPVKYVMSMGSDSDGRKAAAVDAVAQGKLTQERAVAMLPEYEYEIMDVPLLEGQSETAKKIENMAKGMVRSIGHD